MFELAFLFAWPLPPVHTTGGFIGMALGATALFVLLMAGLHQLAPEAKKWLTIVCTFGAGLFFLLEYFLPIRKLKDGSEGNAITPFVIPVSDFIQYMMIWTVGLGLISLTLVHGRRLVRRQADWHNSLAFFLALIAMLVVGFSTQAGKAGTPGARMLYDSLFRGLLISLDAAVFSLLAFYIASAAYRAFRIRTVEAGLLMAAALIVMLGFVNFGVMLTSWIPLDSPWAGLRLEKLSSWILNWLNMPGQRAVTIGVAIGGLAMAMRIWLSLERGAFFSQEK
jgi:hypothetical protein